MEPRQQYEHTNSGRGTPRIDKADPAKITVLSAQAGPTAQRVARHKDKFLAMKERYEQVTTTHEQYKQELAVANEKIRNLQNECNLLLDAVDIAVPGQPTLMHYLQHDPVPLHYTAQNAPIVPEMVPAQPSPVEESEPGRLHATQQLNGTNGHQ